MQSWRQYCAPSRMCTVLAAPTTSESGEQLLGIVAGLLGLLLEAGLVLQHGHDKVWVEAGWQVQGACDGAGRWTGTYTTFTPTQESCPVQKQRCTCLRKDVCPSLPGGLLVCADSRHLGGRRCREVGLAERGGCRWLVWTQRRCQQVQASSDVDWAASRQQASGMVNRLGEKGSGEVAERRPLPHLPVRPPCASGPACCLRVICLAHGRGRGGVALQRVAHAVAVDVPRPQTGALCVLLTRRVDGVKPRGLLGRLLQPAAQLATFLMRFIVPVCILRSKLFSWLPESEIVFSVMLSSLVSAEQARQMGVQENARTCVATLMHCRRRWQIAAAGPLIPLPAAAPALP